MKIAIYQNENKLSKEVFDIVLNKVKEYNFDYDENNPEIVVFAGGDGTFLRAVQHYLDKVDTIKFVGVLTGTLGFFYDYSLDDIDDLFKDIKENKYKIFTHKLIDTCLYYENGEIQNIYSINEIRFENPFHTLICDVYVNNEKLETFRGNGLIVASSIGSTAYNKSLGGAVVEHSIESLQLTEIASIQNSVYSSLDSSLVLSETSKITLKGNFSNTVLGFDYVNMDHNVIDYIDISLSNKKVSLLRKPSYSYINKIKESLLK